MKDVRKMAEMLAGMGRNGDTVLMHVTPKEVDLLDRETDGVSVNPITGLLEAWGESNSEGQDYGGATGDYGGQDTSGPGGENGGSNYGPGYGDSGNLGGLDMSDNSMSAPGVVGAGVPSGYAGFTETIGRDRNVAEQIGGFLSDKAQSLTNALSRPGTYVDALVSAVPGVGTVNSMLGMFGLPTIGGNFNPDPAAGNALGLDMANNTTANPGNTGMMGNNTPGGFGGGSQNTINFTPPPEERAREQAKALADALMQPGYTRAGVGRIYT